MKEKSMASELFIILLIFIIIYFLIAIFLSILIDSFRIITLDKGFFLRVEEK